ncbi:MAG: ribose-phosphate pyrophosphokinase [Eggerthellales bacterium]|nr:ribose-phosphate pyrophosphokinase [Eggerthellales bacterium]
MDTQMTKSMLVFSGSVNPELAQEIAQELGIELGKVKLEKFANGEIYAKYEESVRGHDVFLVQSVAGVTIGSCMDVNDALMEVLIMADAAKRASARSITAVLAHYGYARQDRKAAPREPITAKLVADLLQVAGIDRVITLDLHASQIEGYFDIPVNNLSGMPVLIDAIKKKGFDPAELCIVSPDVGRAKEAKKMSSLMGTDLAIMHKDRPGHNKAEITALIGDVTGKICILNDDMVDTAGSACAAAKTLLDKGAKRVLMTSTHPVLSGPAFDRIKESCIEQLIVCNTIPVDPEKAEKSRIKVVSVAPLLARAIHEVYVCGSVASLFN